MRYCGGCGETDPAKRCIGCLHDFNEPEVAQLIAIDEPEQVEKFDFSSPEDVLIEVVGPHDDDPTNLDWKNWSIESTTVINQANPDVIGAASYESQYGGFLDYTLQGMIDVPGEGWFVIEKMTGQYHKGDGWMTDDDMDFDIEGVRAATEDEIKMA